MKWKSYSIKDKGRRRRVQVPVPENAEDIAYLVMRIQKQMQKGHISQRQGMAMLRMLKTVGQMLMEEKVESVKGLIT